MLKSVVISAPVSVTNDLRVGDRIKFPVYESDFTVDSKMIIRKDTGQPESNEDYFAPWDIEGRIS